MECIHGQSLILCTMKSAATLAPALLLGTMILFLQRDWSAWARRHHTWCIRHSAESIRDVGFGLRFAASDCLPIEISIPSRASTALGNRSW